MKINGYTIEPRANLRGADLRGADLRGAILRDADLRGAILRDADLRDADLRDAILCDADLRDADLRRADLRRADLRDAILCDADLRYANLCGADLRDAILCDADLRRADLRDADLRRADLRDAILCDADLRDADLRDVDLCRAGLYDAKLPAFQIPQEGTLTVWGAKSGFLVKMEVPAEARRTASLIGRKCRAEFVRTLEIIEPGASPDPMDGPVQSLVHNGGCARTEAIYRVGLITEPDSYDDDPCVECTHGIHFFLTREEAEAWL